MPPTRVAILSGPSLFADGVASRLRSRMKPMELLVIDPQGRDAMNQLLDAAPDALILDASDPLVAERYPLDDLLEAMPSLKIIRIDPHQEDVQVVTSQQRQVRAVTDLLDVIEEDI